MIARALTAAAVEKIKPLARRQELSDKHMPGLYLLVQPSGSKSWAIRFRQGGRQKKFRIGSYPTYNLVEARDAASAALRTIAEGRDPIAEREKKKAAHRAGVNERDKFPAVAKTFIQRHAKKGRAWAETARLLGLREIDGALSIVRGGVADRWRYRDVRDVTKRDIIELIDGIIDAGHGPTANRTFGAVRTMYNWAIGRDIVATSPCHGMKPPAKESGRERILSDDEIRWFWKSAEGQGWPFGSIAQLLLLTGQRRDEVAGIDTSELKLAERLWTIGTERVKNKKTHTVPLSDAVQRIIEGVPRIVGRSLLFSTTGTTHVSGFSKGKARIDAEMLASARAELGSDAEIQPWCLHDLRRTAASGLARIGIAPHIIEAVLNHKSGTIKGVAAIYNRHEYSAEKRFALDAWARHVEAIVTGQTANVVPIRSRSQV